MTIATLPATSPEATAELIALKNKATTSRKREVVAKRDIGRTLRTGSEGEGEGDGGFSSLCTEWQSEQAPSVLICVYISDS